MPWFKSILARERNRLKNDTGKDPKIFSYILQLIILFLEARPKMIGNLLKMTSVDFSVEMW